MGISFGKKMTSLRLAALFVAVALWTGVSASAAPAGKMTAADLISALERGEEITVIDVRTPEEFEDGHIPGSVSLPLDDLVGGEGIPPGAVVLYCTAGVRSAKALGILKERGKAEVTELDGGIRAWIAAGGNIVAGPYKETTEYPATYQIPRGVCETKAPAMEVKE